MEIFDVEGIKTNLRSEKAAFRKQGRAMFDSMISQMGTRSISALDALGLIQAVMEYEGKEKQAALSKGKALGHDVAEFFRRVARFALRSGHLLSKHTGPFMNHILSILSDTSLTDYYKSFHKSLLLDILVPRLTFSMDAPDAIDVLDTAGLKGLLLVLSKAFKDAKTRKDSSMLKVLRSTCSCLYMDIDTPTLEKLVQWIYQLACDESERDYQDFTVLMYTAECYTYLLQYHALNILPSMLENYKGISQLLQKAFALCHFKDPQIDTLIGFISVVLNLAKNMTSVFRSSVTYMQQEILHGWSGIFLSDYSLPILCASIQKRLNKELKPAYWATISYSSNIAEPLKSADSKVLLVFRTIAGVLVLSRGSPPAAASEDESTQLSQPSIQSPSERRPLKRHKTDSTSQNAWDTLTLLFGNLLTEYRQVMGETKKKSVLLTHYSFVSCLLSHTLSSSQDGDCVVYHQMICILSKMLESCALVIDLDVTVQDWLSIITSELLEKLCNKDADQSSETFAVMFEKDLVSLFFILCRCLEGYAHRGGVESGVSEFCRNVLITVLKIISSSRITYSTAVGLFEYLQKNSKSLVKHIAIFDRLRIMSSADILGLSLDICAIADILQLDIGPLLSHSSNSLPSFTVEHGSAFLAKYLIIILSCLTRIDIMPGPQLLHTTSWTSTVTKEECTVADDVLNSLIDYNDQRMNICSLQSPNLPELALSTLTGLWIKAAQCVVDDQEGHNHLFIPLLSVLAQLATSPGYINLSDMHHLPQLQEHICACVVDHMIRVEKQDEANSTLNADCINLCNIFSLLPHTTEFDGIMQTKLEMMTELLWHKILNPIAPVAQEPLHVMDIDSLAMSESPNVDPFNLVANALSARNQPRGSIGQGMYKSNVVSVDLATLVVRLMCAVSSSFCFLGEDFQARCSFLDRCLPVNTAVKISTDTMFALAEAAALDGNFVVFQYMIEGCVAWKKEWGPLGYGRILRCLLHIIGQVKDFQIFDYVYNLFDYVISFAIPEDAEFNRFSSRYWFVRAYQVEIIAAIMKSKANMSDIKTNIADLFSKYISDADIRVQHVTACHCSLLAVHFKNKHKVYESLYQNSSHLWIDLLVRGRKRNVLLHLAIQLMVCCSFHKDYESNSSLKYRALLDIMTSCATMHAYVADEVYSKKLRDLQITAIGAISNTQASLDANCCVAECLMHSWLGSKQACPPLLSLHHDLRDYLTLSTFPYPFLKANGNYNITQAETLHLNLDWLLPAICSVQPTQLRWEVLCSLCEHIKIAASDENIANLLKGNIISIKAAEYFAGFLSHSHEEKNICSYYQLKAQYMSDFTERTIRSSEIANLLKNDVTSLLCSLLQRMVFYDENTDALSPDRPQHKVDWTSIERISAQTSNFLESVAKGIGCKDVVALVGKFNVHHVLCSVVKCFKATQSISAVVVIMSILRIVMQCDTIFASQRLSLVILELLDCIIQYVSALPSSGALEDIFKLLFQVAFDLIKLVKSVNDSIYVLSFLHRALSRTRLSTISTEFKSFLQGYHHSSVIHPLELSSVNAKDVQRQLRALHSSYDGVEVWPALIEYCCDPPQEPQQLVVTCSFGSLIEKLHIVAAQCCDGHPIGFGTLWLLVDFFRALLRTSAAKSQHEALMNSSMSYRYDVGKTLVALHACISSINLVHPQKPPSYLSILTDQIIQLVHMIDAEFSWLASGRYNDMLPFSQNYAQEKLLKNCFKRCIDIVEQGDILPSQLVVRFFRDVGPKTLELFSVWIMEGGGKDTLMEQTILTYLRYPTRGTHDRFIINAFFNRFGEESKLQFFDRNLSSKGTFIDLTVKSAQINKIMSYMAEHALDDDVWAHGDCFGVTQFDTYEAFICKLSLHMLLRYQSHYLSKQSHAKGASSTLTEQFFACALPLCLCDVRTAEMVFLYCLCHMIPQSEGAGKYVTLQLLYHHVSIHLCKSSHLKARRLACKSFVMLLQFLTDNCISMLSIVNGGCGQGTCLPNLVCVQTVIEAALGCQDTSVAWYLISFLNEMETFGSGQLITSIGCQVVGQISERLIRDAVVRKTVVDSDLLHALDVSSSLLLQGQMFASKGDFLSALSSYESMLSSNHNVKIPDVQQDIRDAVEHLGIANIARKALSQWDNIKEYDVVGYTPSLHCLSIATVESRKRLMVENVQSKALQFVQSDNMGKFCELLTFVSTRQQEMGVQTAKSTNALELSDLLVLSPSDLIRTIRSAHKSQMRKCMSVLDRLLDKLSAPQAHAISPALYSFWSDTRSSMASSTTATSDATSTIDSIHMDLQEASLLWSKGLKDSAIKLIKAAPCASLLEMVQGLEKKTVPSINSREIRLLLSDALCAAGNWMSHKGVHSIEDVVNEHLNPALDCAQQSVAQMKMDMSEAHASQLMSEDIMVASTRELSCRLAIARFFEQRFQSLNAKVTSRGWQQRQVFLEERVVEITECDRLREELSKEIRAIDSKLGAGQLHLQELRNDKERQYKNVFRHWSSLKKEVEMDSNERDSTYTTLKASLTQCIQHYLASLKLSSSLFSDLLADDSSEYVAQYAEVVDIIFRIVGLWLSSAKLRYHSDLAQEVSTLLLQELRFNKLPLQSFVLLHQQILSRLGSTLCPDKATNQTMQTVVEYFAIAMGRSYPYHVLPTLFSLLHNNVDHVSNSAKHAPADQLKSLEIGKAAASGSVDLDDRQLATRKVLMSIHKHFQEDRGSRNNSNLVVALQRLLVQYVVLAKVSTTELHEKGKIKCIKISALQEKGKRFNELVTADKLSCQVPVLTRSIPLRPLLSSQRNDWVVMLDSCMGQFDVSESGISRPKFITVVGSDGLHYRQIVKGGDDLRQDAVMQQVFENVNITLQRQRRGRSRLISLAMKTWLPEESGEVDSVDRQVYIRTYKVIPTTALTGIMEFVENTAAFGSLLCDHAPLPGAPKSSGKKGLHSRHRPQDWTNSKCQLALKNAVSDSSQKVAVMKSIYENFKPVFRYFFLENFPSPSVWYSRQCQYVNSVAVNSMIGYILGIGDRHAHNVLVDVNSGELVHIDFGIVFEQGQLLSVPETVPFRLTRDIVDGMGVLGVEGKFRKCCEYVLRSLRMHREKLMVILEVVLFDPLYKWSLSPVQMRNKQQQQVGDNEDADAFVPEEGRVAEGKADVTGSSGFDAASRALGRIQSKLRGYEEQLTSGGVALSVEDMVSLTINASMDINNLAQIFPGWRPFL